MGYNFKSARALVYAEDFYCPFAVNYTTEVFKDVGYMEQVKISTLVPVMTEVDNLRMKNGAENVPKVDEAEVIAISNVSVSIDQNHKSSDSLVSCTGSISSSKDDSLLHEKTQSPDEIDRQVDEAFANLDFVSLPDGVIAETSEEMEVAVVDAETNTSQPMFIDACNGSSQVGTVDCAAGNSEPWSSDTVGPFSKLEMETQTEQEYTMKLNDDLKKSLSKKKTPILFPRVVGQTTGPEIPAKIQRVIEDYKKPHSIYNTTSDYDHDELNKENVSFLNKGMCDDRPHKTLKLDGNVNDTRSDQFSNFDCSRLRACSAPTSTRRLGISKKVRILKPLHPRTSQN